VESIRVFNRTITLEQMQRGVVLGCVCFCAALLYNQSFPEFQTLMVKRAENQSKRDSIERNRLETRNREEIMQRLGKVHSELATVRSRFPSKNDILSTLIVDLSDLFKQYDCELLSFTPGIPEPLTGMTAGEITQDLQLLPITISANGSYSSLITLFKRLSKYDRVVDMSGLTLDPISGESGAFSNKLAIRFTLTTYVLGK
jgi:Tfp pilus assembly protein PilO